MGMDRVGMVQERRYASACCLAVQQTVRAVAPTNVRSSFAASDARGRGEATHLTMM